ncbi:MAG: methyltransferase domain-containing protein [Ignavibacteria bacterium]|nr:methyltransferase domain-containing protein [Ignavibacteria bacterium]
MLDSKGFDKWAGEYDRSIAESSKGYPFEGYYDVLSSVHSLVKEPEGKNILDIGIGTGLLTNELYKKGANIFGLDFSERMIAEAKIKMPDGSFYISDMKDGIPDALNSKCFDYIVSSYAIHHLDKEEKLKFLKDLKDILDDEGSIIIADISFRNNEDLAECKLESEHKWDEEEHYMVIEDLTGDLLGMGFTSKYTQISKYAGVLELSKNS